MGSMLVNRTGIGASAACVAAGAGGGSWIFGPWLSIERRRRRRGIADGGLSGRAGGAGLGQFLAEGIQEAVDVGGLVVGLDREADQGPVHPAGRLGLDLMDIIEAPV